MTFSMMLGKFMELKPARIVEEPADASDLPRPGRIVNNLTFVGCVFTIVIHWSTHRRVNEMLKKLVKHGNSLAIVLDRPILDLFKMDPESQVELTTDGQAITIGPDQMGRG